MFVVFFWLFNFQVSAQTFEFELDDDVLEIMPYGIAADLLKSDVSSSYGQIYANRYRELLQGLDPRDTVHNAVVVGGYDV